MGQGEALLVAAVQAGVAVRVFVAVQVALERPVVGGDQRQLAWQVGGQPAFGVVLAQGPLHDVQALRDDLATRQHQHRHGGLEDLG